MPQQQTHCRADGAKRQRFGQRDAKQMAPRDAKRPGRADWGTGFGAGIAHDGKLWVISGIGHDNASLPLNLRYTP
jgi:hypothetical protein